MKTYRLGVDIGGTFTDFALVDEVTGEVQTEKMLTSAAAPEQTVFNGVDKLSNNIPSMLSQTSQVIHATTLITNVILERKGAKTGLLTTLGFRDVLEIAREVRYDIYDMFIRIPEPMVPRSRRLEICERILADGKILKPLKEKDVHDAASVLGNMGVTAVAISFLHSYRNDIHEKRAAEIIREKMPGVVVSLSHEVHPEPKEYERTSTTVIDAYVKGVAEGYLDQLLIGLNSRDYKKQLFIMLSNGGTATVETAKSVPVQIVESGPAAGVEAAAYFGRLMEIHQLLSFDMGGTTAKLCIIENGQAARTRSFEVDRVHRFKAGSGLPAAVPVYDLLEMGAGGGSIARVNDLGLFQVGPDSAGSDPGPVSYDNNGTLPTVTDADLLLGYLNPDYFLGGEMTLNINAAENAITSYLSESSGLTAIEAAAGVHELVNENMASAARVYVAEKGRAPSQLALVAFGGAGPVHAVGLARKLGCPTVIIPPFSGVMSSLGLLAAPVAFERSKTVREILNTTDLMEVEANFNELEVEASSLMPNKSDIIIRRSVDLQFSGQDYPLEITVDGSCTKVGAKDGWEDMFINKYNALYGKVNDENPIELASIRVYVSQSPPLLKIERPAAHSKALPKGTRKIYISAEQGMDTAVVFERSELMVGQKINGPCIIEEKESTTVIGPNDSLDVNEFGCLIIDIGHSNISSVSDTDTFSITLNPDVG